MKLTKIDSTQTPTVKPKRCIYGGVLYHGEEFSLNRKLFGNSPNGFSPRKDVSNVWTAEKYNEAVRQHVTQKSRFLRVSTNEKTLIRSTIRESIKDVGIYPTEIVVDTPSGKSERWLVTE